MSTAVAKKNVEVPVQYYIQHYDCEPKIIDTNLLNNTTRPNPCKYPGFEYSYEKFVLGWILMNKDNGCWLVRFPKTMFETNSTINFPEAEGFEKLWMAEAYFLGVIRGKFSLPGKVEEKESSGMKKLAEQEKEIVASPPQEITYSEEDECDCDTCREERGELTLEDDEEEDDEEEDDD